MVHIWEQVFKVLRSDLSKSADIGTHLSCRFQRAVR